MLPTWEGLLLGEDVNNHQPQNKPSMMNSSKQLLLPRWLGPAMRVEGLRLGLGE